MDISHVMRSSLVIYSSSDASSDDQDVAISPSQRVRYSPSSLYDLENTAVPISLHSVRVLGVPLTIRSLILNSEAAKWVARSRQNPSKGPHLYDNSHLSMSRPLFSYSDEEMPPVEKPKSKSEYSYILTRRWWLMKEVSPVRIQPSWSQTFANIGARIKRDQESQASFHSSTAGSNLIDMSPKSSGDLLSLSTASPTKPDSRVQEAMNDEDHVNVSSASNARETLIETSLTKANGQMKHHVNMKEHLDVAHDPDSTSMQTSSGDVLGDVSD